VFSPEVYEPAEGTFLVAGNHEVEGGIQIIDSSADNDTDVTLKSE